MLILDNRNIPGVLTRIILISLLIPTMGCRSNKSSPKTYPEAFKYLSVTKLQDKATKHPHKLKLGDWQRILTAEQFGVTRLNQTERRNSSPYNKIDQKGIFHCVSCGNPLFDFKAKYNSGTGWPSFFQPIGKDAVATDTDYNLGVARTEVHCARCGAHLGHVFNDGPQPTGLRYCMNGVAMKFVAKP